MPFGKVLWSRRLGIANISVYNAANFGHVVLRLPSQSLVYGQQLVRAKQEGEGPDRAGTDTCCGLLTADSEIDRQTTVREISVHDTQFARRNISSNQHGAITCPSLPSHRGNYTWQIYYVNNEPEMYSVLRDTNILPCTSMTAPGYPSDSGCWDPRDRIIDSAVAGSFPNPNTSFWELLTPSPPVNNPPGLTFCRDVVNTQHPNYNV
jgi:hypothetical protein